MIFFYSWFLGAFAFLLFELCNPGMFFFLALACASLIASLFAFFDFQCMVQMGAFCVTAVISFVILLKIKNKLAPQHHHQTNVFALQGKTGIVVVPLIKAQQGHVKVEGQIWSARSHDCTIIEINQEVEVLQVVGCHLIVRVINK